jgi:uncharacterized PurR-regulated membrane protein YhhQ (DUF165 family)
MTRTSLTVTYAALVVLANWLASKWIVGVGFGLAAPAGVFCIGAVLVIRDWLQQITSFRYTLAVLVATGLLSYAVSEVTGWALGRIALASLGAFLVSETLEALIFTPIRRRSLTLGVGLSATIGILVDSFLFLWIAFGSVGYWEGNSLGKGYMLLVGVALTALRRRLIPVESALTRSKPV